MTWLKQLISALAAVVKYIIASRRRRRERKEQAYEDARNAESAPDKQSAIDDLYNGL